MASYSKRHYLASIFHPPNKQDLQSALSHYLSKGGAKIVSTMHVFLVPTEISTALSRGLNQQKLRAFRRDQRA